MILKGRNILIISPESWGEVFVSKHHYAAELSRANQVYFLNPPSDGLSREKVNKSLYVINYRPPVRGVNHIPAFLRNAINSLTISRVKTKVNLPDFDIVWSFDPFRFQNLNIFRGAFRIYHPVDVHAAELEKEAASTADIILTTCMPIKNRLAAFNTNIYNIGHGISGEFIKRTSGQRDTPTNRSSKSPCIKIGMMGNLQRKIDYPVLFRIIQNNPDGEFHFIGPHGPSNLGKTASFTPEIKRLLSFENTFLHGTVPQENLPEWLEGMDVFLVLYRKDENPAARANPHKMLEYLATGKVIVSSFTEEYADKRDLIEMVGQNEDFETRLSEVLDNLGYHNSPEKKKKRMQLAMQHTYSQKIREIESIIDQHQNRNTR